MRLATPSVLVLSLIGCADKVPDPQSPIVTTFDPKETAASLVAVDLSGCKPPDGKPTEGHVSIRFANNGDALNVKVDDGPLIGTSAVRCVEDRFRRATVPPFVKGDGKSGTYFVLGRK